MHRSLLKTQEILTALRKELRRDPIRRIRCENLVNRADLIIRKAIRKSPTETAQTIGDK